MENIFYIYAHYTKDTKELFYIGKGKNNRAYIKTKRNPLWTNISNKHGFLICILEVNLNEIDAYSLEEKYIKELRPRANISIGGKNHFSGYKRSPESVAKGAAKASITMLAKKFKQPEEVRRKIAATLRGRVGCRLGSKASEETKRKIGIKSKGRISKMRKKVKCLDNDIVFDSIATAAKWCNGATTHISACCCGKAKTHKQLRWVYV